MLGALGPEEMEDVLRGQVIGRIGCVLDGRIYVVPVTYAYDGECVYAHSAEGLKIRAMRAHPAVCFEVEQVEDLARWRSVIAAGTYEELRGDDARRGMEILIDRMRPLMTSETARPTHGSPPAGGPPHVPVLFRIRLGERTGRFERGHP